MTTANNTNNILQFPVVIFAEMKHNPVAMKFVISCYEFRFR